MKTIIKHILFLTILILLVTCKKSDSSNGTHIGVPSTPQNLTVEVVDNHIQLSWNASDNADYYEITNAFKIRDNNNAWGDTCRVFLGNTTNNYYIDLYPFDSLNYYRIKAINQCGSSSYNEISCNYWIENPKMWFYPNPTKGNIILNGEGNITVEKMSGEIIDEFNLYGIDAYDMGQYEDDIYLLHFHSVSGETVRRVVVNHEWGYLVEY